MAFLFSQLFITPKYPTQSFQGKTIIVTGSNTGLGKEAARHFTRLDAEKVILAVRNLEAGEAAKQSIEESTKRLGVCEVWELDLSSYASVQAFAARARKLPRLDVLCENAGIMPVKFDTAEGHEASITINVISTFLLFLQLLPTLQATAKAFPDSKPVASIVSSEVHAWCKFPEWKADNVFLALDDPKKSDLSERYQVSKLLEVLIVREIAPRLADTSVILNFVNPGLCQSELTRDSGSWSLRVMKALLARTTEVGSRSLLAAAAAGSESHGGYVSDGHVANNSLSSFVKSEDGRKAQKKIWKELSEILDAIQSGVASSI